MTQLQRMPSNDSMTVAVLNWIGTLVFLFVPPLMLYQNRKDDPLVFDHAKEALNWSITVIIMSVALWIVTGWLLLRVLMLVHLVFCVLGAVNASKGVSYRLPFNIRLIK
ncbi:DUF4870 domain-containing protein [Chitiniphilus purpureus]|uniref:DUF4870 domain-containing protein n=1 Tax=Chitiniphilus purpureus TaxID=2981137 RepID=A0ABY6DPI2_9NEIS|nr:DUF4870 domain-containing protein [Chitiniphilus sp. CD1]UXY16275.1 DUF4870 domain-containing protein [Chitiniphilus sp. CD1]